MSLSAIFLDNPSLLAVQPPAPLVPRLSPAEMSRKLLGLLPRDIIRKVIHPMIGGHALSFDDHIQRLIEEFRELYLQRGISTWTDLLPVFEQWSQRQNSKRHARTLPYVWRNLRALANDVCAYVICTDIYIHGHSKLTLDGAVQQELERFDAFFTAYRKLTVDEAYAKDWIREDDWADWRYWRTEVVNNMWSVHDDQRLFSYCSLRHTYFHFYRQFEPRRLKNLSFREFSLAFASLGHERIHDRLPKDAPWSAQLGYDASYGVSSFLPMSVQEQQRWRSERLELEVDPRSDDDDDHWPIHLSETDAESEDGGEASEPEH